MAANAEQVNVHVVNIDWYFTDSLRGISMKEYASFSTNLADLCYRLNHSDLIVHENSTNA